MPLHRFSHKDARDEVAALEENGETVTAVATDDGGVYVATSKNEKRRAPGRETR